MFLPMTLFGQADKPIGINISSIHDYATELTFTDAFKQCREWIPFQADGAGSWTSGVDIPLGASGYPLEIPYDNGNEPPQAIRTLVLWDLPETSFPAGFFRLIVQGTGKVQLRFGAEGVFSTPVDTLVYADAGTAIELLHSESTDPVSSIQFILPAYINNFPGKTFTDEFVNFLDDFQCIRFMDWLRTNGSPVETWEERGQKDYYTQATARGGAIEYLIELSNTTQKDLWINIPHLADDSYILQLAQLLKQEVDPTLKIYLEYSNEVWNGGFLQHQEAAALAEAVGYSGTEWERAWKYTARRSADLFAIFEDVFGSANRLVRVIPTQAANPWLSNQLITFFKDPLYNPEGVSADALAIAPYFAGSVANQLVDEGLVTTITIPEILARMDSALAQSFAWMQENRQVADNHGLELITYEGGQHLVATGNNINNLELTEKLIEANHHPDLEAIYCAYFDYWYSNHGGLFTHFSSHGKYSKWGSWGVKETFEDVQNPKYLALQHCVFNESTVTREINHQSTGMQVFPNPSISGLVNLESREKIESIALFSLSGKKIDASWIYRSEYNGTLSIPNPGFYVLSVNNRQKIRIVRL